MTTSSGVAAEGPTAMGTMRVAARAIPRMSAGRPILLRFDPHELDRAAQRLHEIDECRVGVLGQEHAPRAQNEAGACRLLDCFLRLGSGVGSRALLEGGPLVEPALHRARHQRLAFGEGPSRAPIVT